MRCPDCRKRVHADDVYCVWCGAPLRKGIVPSSRDSVMEDLPETDLISQTDDISEKGQHSGRRFLVLSFILLLLAAGIWGLFRLNTPRHLLPEPTAMDIPENAEELDVLLSQWEGFTLRGSYISQDEVTGAVEIFFVANNDSDDTVLCADPLFSLEAYQLRGSMYLELPPGESTVGSIRLETAPLQSIGLHEVREMVMSLPLYRADNAALLTCTVSDAIPWNRELPQRDMRSEHAILLEEPGLGVYLTGIETDPETGELCLYTLMENTSAQENFLYLEKISWENRALGSANYYSLPVSARLLTCSRLYDIPSGTEGQISIEMATGTGDGQSCTVLLTEEGTVADVISSG